MRSPVKPVPQTVHRWSARARRLRWLDAALAWLGLWIGSVVLAPAKDPTALAVVAALVALAGAAVPPLRRCWRPASAVVALGLSWRLRPGDRAWYVNGDGARLVLVTSRRLLGVVVAGTVQDSLEGVRLRRTRGFLVRAGHP